MNRNQPGYGWNGPQNQQNTPWNGPQNQQSPPWNGPRYQQNGPWNGPQNQSPPAWVGPQNQPYQGWDSPQNQQYSGWNGPQNQQYPGWNSPQNPQRLDWNGPQNQPHPAWDSAYIPVATRTDELITDIKDDIDRLHRQIKHKKDAVKNHNFYNEVPRDFGEGSEKDTETLDKCLSSVNKIANIRRIIDQEVEKAKRTNTPPYSQVPKVDGLNFEGTPNFLQAQEKLQSRLKHLKSIVTRVEKQGMVLREMSLSQQYF